MPTKVQKSEQEWRRQLTPEQYEVTRKAGTERAFTGQYWNVHDKGLFRCVCCGNALFSSATKFESGTGWPSFWAPIAKENIEFGLAELVTVLKGWGLGLRVCPKALYCE